MHSLTLKGCSFAFTGFYSPPRTFAAADLQRVATGLLQEFTEYNLDPSAINLDRGDGLFQYALRAALFNRLMSMTISAQTLEANFTTLLGAADRALAFECLKRMISVCGDGLGPNCFIELAVHAAFASEQQRDAFFSANVPSGLDSSGVLGYIQMSSPNQLIRLEIDRSWGYDNAAFIGWRTTGMQLAALQNYTHNLWETLFALLNPFELELHDE